MYELFKKHLTNFDQKKLKMQYVRIQKPVFLTIWILCTVLQRSTEVIMLTS